MDIDELNGCNDQVTVQPGAEKLDQSSVVPLDSISDLNTNNTAIIPGRSLESAMEDLAIQVHDFQYSCKTKGFEVKKRTKMTMHLQTKHDQYSSTVYRCEICKKEMNDYTHFLKHKFIHTEEKQFKCDKCDSSFAKSFLLHYHSGTMHIDDPISCNVCQKLCFNKRDLRLHKTYHCGKPVICEKCGKHLGNKEKLHIHTGVKPYTCRVCRERAHPGDKTYICRICNIGFTHHLRMQIHEFTHRMKKSIQCNICAKPFSSNLMYKVHVRKCRANNAVEEEMNLQRETESISLPEQLNPSAGFYPWDPHPSSPCKTPNKFSFQK